MTEELKEKINEVAEKVITQETDQNEKLLKRHFEIAHEIRPARLFGSLLRDQ